MTPRPKSVETRPSGSAVSFIALTVNEGACDCVIPGKSVLNF